MANHPPELSGFGLRVCLRGIHVAYLAVTILAVLMNRCAASMNFAGAKSVNHPKGQPVDTLAATDGRITDRDATV
jgi:hypothetical protein